MAISIQFINQLQDQFLNLWVFLSYLVVFPVIETHNSLEELTWSTSRKQWQYSENKDIYANPGIPVHTSLQ